MCASFVVTTRHPSPRLPILNPLPPQYCAAKQRGINHEQSPCSIDRHSHGISENFGRCSHTIWRHTWSSCQAETADQVVNAPSEWPVRVEKPATVRSADRT